MSAKNTDDAVAARKTPRPPTSLADYVYGELLSDIQMHRLQPGASIVQDEVASRLGVSITPVREALRRLESAGHITYAPRVGATVTQLSSDAIAELYQLRTVVEGLAVRLATQKATPADVRDLRAMHEEMVSLWNEDDAAGLAAASRRFHSRIAEIGGPAYLAKHLALIWEKATIPPTQSIWSNRNGAKASINDHTRLIDLIESGSAEEAEQMMLAHIVQAIEWRQGTSDPAH